MNSDPRLKGIDALRGLAVVLMVLANLAPTLGGEPPIWYRLLASGAAPLFIALSGWMVGASSARGSHDLTYYLKRGSLLWLMAAFVDLVAWRNAPFITFDVLYLIGASLPLSSLLCRLPGRWGIVCAVALLAFGPLSVALLGYDESLPAASLGRMHALGQGEIGAMAEALVFDGWFPLFPWAGVAGVSALLGKARANSSPGFDKTTVLVGIALTLVGGLWWASAPGPAHEREGYAELFYPATPGFLLCSVGGCLASIAAALRLHPPRWFFPLIVLGESSLLAYIAHCLILGHLVHPALDNVSFGLLISAALAVIPVLVGLSWMARWVRGKWKRRPLLLRMLLGG